jgi:glycosyltransferase involved in cell wall biosynthesis
MRYAWDLQHQYLRESGLEKGIKGFIAKYLLHRLRLWDLRTANGVDVFVANSQFIAQRIWKVYRRKSKVVYPPVYVQDFVLQNNKEDFYVTASRMVPYKKIDIIVEAFKQMPDQRLLVIGDGPDFVKISKIAQGCKNIKLMGFQPFAVLKDCLQRAKGFVFAAEEDFGITPVEAMACGTPVIAFGKGGVLETVKQGETGLFFAQQTSKAIMDAISEFECQQWSSAACRLQAEQFSIEHFQHQFAEIERACRDDCAKH